MASPITSPFKSIINCAKKAIDWGTGKLEGTEPSKDEYSVAVTNNLKVKLVRTPAKDPEKSNKNRSSRSRSVSPEIDKVNRAK